MLSTVCGFALVWQMWPLAALSFAVLIAGTIFHTFNYNRDFHIPAADVGRVEHARTQLLTSHV